MSVACGAGAMRFRDGMGGGDGRGLTAMGASAEGGGRVG
ncbi:hypothetical protein FraQA3DRAFT_1813, partial [Frankia sp. QA3]